MQSGPVWVLIYYYRLSAFVVITSIAETSENKGAACQFIINKQWTTVRCLKTEWAWNGNSLLCLSPCFSKIQIGFTFLVPAYPGSPGKRAVKWVCLSPRKRAHTPISFWRQCTSVHEFEFTEILRGFVIFAALCMCWVFKQVFPGRWQHWCM